MNDAIRESELPSLASPQGDRKQIYLGYGISPYFQVPMSLFGLALLAPVYLSENVKRPEWPWDYLILFLAIGVVAMGIVKSTEIDGNRRLLTWRWKLWGVLPLWRRERRCGGNDCLSAEMSELRYQDGASYRHRVMVRGEMGQATLCEVTSTSDRPAPTAIEFLRQGERLLALPIDACGEEYLNRPPVQPKPLTRRAKMYGMVGVIGFGFGSIFFFCIGAASLVRGVQSLGWKETSAVVVDPPVQHFSEDPHRMRYSFDVDGMRVMSDWQDVQSPWTDGNPGTWELKKKLPVGGRLTVYYDERDPNRSTMRRGPRWDSAFMIAFGIAFGGCAWVLAKAVTATQSEE